jgi:uncharacterized protein
MKSKITALVMLILLSGIVSAYPKLNGYVNDFANLLSDSEEQQLTHTIEQIQANSTVEIAVVTVESTNGEDRTMFANKMGEQNGVGKKTTDNGVVILWSLDNEQGGAIATGRGIESILTDSEVGRIGRGSRQYFDDKKYYDGFNYILVEVDKQVNAEYPTGVLNEDYSDWWIWLIIILVIIFLLFFLIPLLSGGGGSWSGGSYVSSGGFSSSSGGGFSFGGGSFGGGGAHF